MVHHKESQPVQNPPHLTSARTSHSLGVTLVVVSAAVFSTAGLFSKGLTASAWDIIFWRGIFAALFTIAYSCWRGAFIKDFPQMGTGGIAAGIVGAASTAAFIPAFKYTSIANVSLIYAATPLFAAVIARIWIGERMRPVVIIGCIASLIGVATIVFGSLGHVNLTGDLLALWMALTMAIIFVIYRVWPATPAAGPATLSSIVLLPFAMAFGTPFNNSMHEIIIMAVFGAVFAVASVTLAEGAKRLPAGEAALLSNLEVALAPILAWLVFSEFPVTATFLGGALVVIGVLISQRQPAPQPAGQKV
jgi:drug/metabolite transporter (DMT)-like permease